MLARPFESIFNYGTPRSVCRHRLRQSQARMARVNIEHDDRLPAFALKVREPFASRIVDGLKVWEMRRYRTAKRGRIAILSHRGLVGTVELVDVLGPFLPAQLCWHVAKHRTPVTLLQEYSRGRPLYAWVLQNPTRLNPPLRIRVSRGPAVWFRLSHPRPRIF